MQLEVLVEEPSAEEVLKHILPRIVPAQTPFKLVNLGSKTQLLKRLPQRLAAYHDRLQRGEPLRIVVLIDRDNDACEELKATLERVARDVGLATKSNPDANGRFYVVNRIAIEELEAWFIGDPDALRSAFTGLPPIMSTGIFRNPDNISRGTWESLHKFLKKNGIYRNSYPKIEAARRIAPHLDLARNRSASFRTFCRGVEALFA